MVLKNLKIDFILDLIHYCLTIREKYDDKETALIFNESAFLIAEPTRIIPPVPMGTVRRLLSSVFRATNFKQDDKSS